MKLEMLLQEVQEEDIKFSEARDDFQVVAEEMVLRFEDPAIQELVESGLLDELPIDAADLRELHRFRVTLNDMKRALRDYQNNTGSYISSTVIPALRPGYCQ